MTSLTKNPHPPSKKIFFKCRLEDFLRLLTLRPGLWLVQKRRNSRTKPRAFRQFFRKSPKAAGRQSVKQILQLLNLLLLYIVFPCRYTNFQKRKVTASIQLNPDLYLYMGQFLLCITQSIQIRSSGLKVLTRKWYLNMDPKTIHSTKDKGKVIPPWLFFGWDISTIFCWDILVTETFWSFVSQLY